MSSSPSHPRVTIWQEFRGVLVRAREVWSLLGLKEKRLLRLAMIPMFLFAAAQSGIALLAGWMVGELAKSREQGTMATDWPSIAFRYIVLIGLLSLGREVFLMLRKQWVGDVQARVERNLTIGLVSHLFRQTLQSLSKDHIGAIHGRAIRGISSFTHFLRLVFREFLPAVFAVAVAVLYAFVCNYLMGLLLLAALVAAMVLIARQLKAQQGMFDELSRSSDILDGTVIEQLEGMEYIRAANTINIEVARISRVAERRYECGDRLSNCATKFDALKSLNEWMFYLAALGIAVYLAVHERIQVGEILTLLGLMSNMTSPLRDMHRILDDSYETSIRLNDVMMIMDELLDPSFVVDVDTEPTIVKRFGERRPAAPKIEFREPKISHDVPVLATDRLVVEYGERESRRRILNEVSVRFELGEIIGLAGPSGSGKSTLLRVLLRLVPVTSGTAHFGGVPIQNVSRDSIGRLIGYVSQNPFVFSGTIADNIAYGCGDVTRAAIQAAAVKAGIHDEISAIPGGYDAVLHERGTNISGGQRQRIAIARVFLKNPPILVLDEGTSALDNVGEQKVQMTLDALRGSHAVILVAHRLTTLRSADRILVFDQGRIVQSGSMDELADQDGVFRELMKVAEAT